ncbi:MAG: hypothetical protein ACLTQI_04860 [Slackia sp.]
MGIAAMLIGDAKRLGCGSETAWAVCAKEGTKMEQGQAMTLRDVPVASAPREEAFGEEPSSVTSWIWESRRASESSFEGCSARMVGSHGSGYELSLEKRGGERLVGVSRRAYRMAFSLSGLSADACFERGVR